MDGFWRTIKNRGIRTTQRERGEGEKVLKLALGAAAQDQLLCEHTAKK